MKTRCNEQLARMREKVTREIPLTLPLRETSQILVDSLWRINLPGHEISHKSVNVISNESPDGSSGELIKKIVGSPGRGFSSVDQADKMERERKREPASVTTHDRAT